jgi:iron complex outermembrane receptor protein
MQPTAADDAVRSQPLEPAQLAAGSAAGSPTLSAAAEQAEPAGGYGARAKVERAGAPRFGTGSKQGVPLEELPASVTSIAAETLRVRGINNLDEALTLTSGITPTWQYGGFLHIALRGMQALTLFDGYRDSRAIFADSAPQQGVFDLDRIEVLRGPSSVLYGYGAVGGVVNLVRKQPSRRNAYEIDFGLGLPDQQLLHAGAQGPIGEHLSYRIDLGHTQRTDYRGASTERNQVSAVLRYTPMIQHTFDLRLSYALDHYNTDVGIPTIEDPRRRGRWILPPNARRENRYGTSNDHLDYKRFDVSLDYRFDFAERSYLRAHAGVARDDYEYLAAESLTYVAAMEMMPARVEREYLPFARAWQPVVGQLELHTDQDTGPVQHRLVFGYELDHFSGDTRNADTGDVVPGAVDFVYPIDRAPLVAFQTTSFNHYRHVTHSLYGFDHVKLIESLIVTGGVRFDSVRSRVAKDYVDRFSGDEVDDAMGNRRPVLHTHREAFTGQAGIVWSPVQPIAAYAGYSSSFKPMFVNPGDLEANQWEPERGQQVEAGLRGRVDTGGHRLDIDLAVYWIEKRNVLISRGMDDYTQAGKLRSQGLDVAVAYHAPRWLDLSAAYSLDDATYRRFVEPDPVTGDNRSLRGKLLDFTPRHSASAWIGVRLSEQIGIGFGGRFMAKQFADPENRVPMPDYALLDASAWWKTEHASVTLSARNLLDEREYYSSAINQWAANPQVTPGPGRELLCTLRLQL